MVLTFALFPSTLLGALPVCLLLGSGGEVTVAEAALPQPRERAVLSGHDVRLRDIHFSYTGHEENEVLHGISLKLLQGSFTALVGLSGGEKTSLRRWEAADRHRPQAGHYLKNNI
ncbi:MAG: hypothetical protein Q4C50_13205 [Eubacteriales bacterium]|nr:hypothetical protein [Eubacteriales bacterium]